MSAATYPVRVDASLDAPLSRWLWLVKWVLVIPHYIVLGFLWIAYVVLSAVAFFAILFTGRYPRSIFEFNVGVLRWTWRVQYYAYGALGTDKYPPFSLQDDPSYPARLQVEYPQRLSRGLVLVKWWLLAIPHYIIVGLFAGGGVVVATRVGEHVDVNWAGSGLIGIMVVIAAVVLLITGRYPDPIFGFVLGMNRWVLRVAAYAGLMTDQYPPFRLDMGGHEPGSPVMFQAPTAGPAVALPGGAAVPDELAPGQAEPGTGAGGPPAEPQEPGTEAVPPPVHPAARGWTAGRVISVVAGALLLIVSLGLLSGGATLLWADQLSREGGYVTSASRTFTTGARALVSEPIVIHGPGVARFARDFVGTVRIRVTAADPSKTVFVGIAREADVARYLSGARYTTVHDIGSATRTQVTAGGSAVPAAPLTARIWAATAAGRGTQRLLFTPASGDWAVVVMNPNAAPGLAVRADIGATAPSLPWIEGTALATGVLVAVAGVFLIVIPVRRVSRAS